MNLILFFFFQPKAVFFTCMDSRMIPTRFTETNVGDMFVGECLYSLKGFEVTELLLQNHINDLHVSVFPLFSYLH
jgi:hypothetical protein